MIKAPKMSSCRSLRHEEAKVLMSLDVSPHVWMARVDARCRRHAVGDSVPRRLQVEASDKKTSSERLSLRVGR